MLLVATAYKFFSTKDGPRKPGFLRTVPTNLIFRGL